MDVLTSSDLLCRKLEEWILERRQQEREEQVEKHASLGRLQDTAGQGLCNNDDIIGRTRTGKAEGHGNASCERGGTGRGAR